MPQKIANRKQRSGKTRYSRTEVHKPAITSMYILGINAYHGDAAAALIKDGRIVAAVEEERFNRIKHCAGFPAESVKYCLRVAGIEIDAVDHVGISRDPSAHLDKKVLFAAARTAKEIVGSK